MKLLLFRSLWTNGFDLDTALDDCKTGRFDGIEGPVPSDSQEREIFSAKLSDAGVPFIAEICTAGGYVPKRIATVEQHLEDFRRKLEVSLECVPLFLTSLAGCDAWPLARSVEFFGRAMDFAAASGVAVGFETHRSRSTFNPWTTRDLLTELPALRLTCDYSHWCCVCERLIDTEPDVLALCAGRAQHVHARVGYDQGPQVPHPAAPEYLAALEAHERWWKMIWLAHARAGREFTTMTPEFGPDGYLQAAPFSQKPVADLDEINRWMADRMRATFAAAELDSNLT
ncbi:MAG: sugar phosphate isomerase/epimerase [Chthoniobacterales bacterium]